MKKEIEISLPQSYADITLKRYLQLQKELKNYEGEEDAQTAIIIQHLTGLNVEQLGSVSNEGIQVIKAEILKFLGDVELPFQQKVKIDGKLYGFEPNLSEMSYGAYVDITKYETIQIDDNWPKIMNILYRPVTKEVGNGYDISPYVGDSNWEKWLDVGMDVHFGALFFFVHLQKDLLKSILKYLKEAELHPSTRIVLEKSGELIHQYTNLPMEILLGLKK